MITVTSNNSNGTVQTATVETTVEFENMLDNTLHITNTNGLGDVYSVCYYKKHYTRDWGYSSGMVELLVNVSYQEAVDYVNGLGSQVEESQDVVNLGEYAVSQIRACVSNARDRLNPIMITVTDTCFYAQNAIDDTAEIHYCKPLTKNDLDVCKRCEIYIYPSMISYTKSNPGLLDIDPTGTVTLRLVNNVLQLECDNWKANIKQCNIEVLKQKGA